MNRPVAPEGKKVVYRVLIEIYEDGSLDMKGPDNNIALLGVIECAKMHIGYMVTKANLEAEKGRVEVIPANALGILRS